MSLHSSPLSTAPTTTYTAEQITQCLTQYFGYSTFRSLQETAINNILNNNDVMIIMATGAGKSLCYQLPALLTHKPTVIVSPLISLMNDQCSHMRIMGITAIALHSQNNDKHAINDILNNKYSLIYISPERINTHINLIHQLYSAHGITMFAVDECHACSEWGHDFRPAYRTLNILRSTFPSVPIMSLTATATAQVESDVINILQLHKPVIVRTTFNRINLTYTVRQQTTLESDLTNDLIGTQPCIIYCLSQSDTERISNYVTTKLGVTSAAYHAGLPDHIRQQVHEQFINDELQCVVATIAFGMGIDKSDIRKIIHYGCTKSIESYVQQTGRAGRDGLPADCIMLYSTRDFVTINYLNQSSNLQTAQHNMKMSDAMKQYISAADCRRKSILQYFGESYNVDNCQSCDNCMRHQSKSDLTDAARLICTCMYECNESFGAAMYVNVLSGTATKKLLEKQHRFKCLLNDMKSYKSMKHYTQQQIRLIIQLLINNNVLRGVFVGAGAFKTTIYKLSSIGHRLLSDRTFRLPLITLNQQMIDSQHKQSKSSSPTRYQPTFGTPESSVPLSDTEILLLNQLIELRKQIATKLSLAPYMVLSRQQLLSMTKYRPVTVHNMKYIPDISNNKLQQFGQQFIDCIALFCQRSNLSTNQVPDNESVVLDDEDNDVSLTQLPRLELDDVYPTPQTKPKVVQSNDIFRVSVNSSTTKSVPQPSTNDIMNNILHARTINRAFSDRTPNHIIQNENNKLQQFLSTLTPAQRKLYDEANQTNSTKTSTSTINSVPPIAVKHEIDTTYHEPQSTSLHNQRPPNDTAHSVKRTYSSHTSQYIKYKPATFYLNENCKLTPAKIAVHEQLLLGESVDDIAVAKSVRLSTVYTYIADLILNGYDIPLAQFNISDSVINDIYTVLDRHYSNHHVISPPLLREIKPELDDTITYDVIRLCLAKYRVELNNKLEYNQCNTQSAAQTQPIVPMKTESNDTAHQPLNRSILAPLCKRPKTGTGIRF